MTLRVLGERRRFSARVALVTFASALGACAPAYSSHGFDVNFPDTHGDALAAVAQQLASSGRSEGGGASRDAVVVLVPPAPAQGFALFELPSGRQRFRVETPIDGRPVLTPTLVVVHGEGRVYGFDRSTGAERFRVADQGLPLLGAGGDAQYVALTYSAGGVGHQPGLVRVLDAQTGAVRFSREVDASLGTPTVLNGLLMLPWSGQYLSVFDVRRDVEVARVRSRDDVYARAFYDEGAAYFGSRAIYRLEAQIGDGRRPDGIHALTLARTDLPGAPPLLLDGYARARAGLDARERVRMAVRPDPANPGVAPAGGVGYALFHRAVFALDRAAMGDANTAPRWAYTHERDLSGAEPVRAGLLACDESGELVLVDAATGGVTFRVALATQNLQAVIDAPLDFTPPREASAPREPSAARGLDVAAGGTDTALLPARIFAVRALAQTPGSSATRALLDIASRRSYPAEVLAAARDALGRRSDDASVLIAALAERHDWVSGRRAPAVAPIATALASARDARAAAALSVHLQDPATPLLDLPAVLTALDTLNDASVLPVLLDFLRLYHADAGVVLDAQGRPERDERSAEEADALATALATAARTISRLGGPTERRWLVALAADANTVRPLRADLEHAAALRDEPVASAPGAAPRPTEALPAVPPRATRELIERGFAPVRGEMLRCVDALASRPSTVRITFHYNGDGTLNTVAVAPPGLGDCVLPLARTVRLPPTQVRTDTGAYYLLGGTGP